MEVRIPSALFESNPANARILKEWIRKTLAAREDVHFVTMAEVVLFIQRAEVTEEGDVKMPTFPADEKCQLEEWDEPCQSYHLRPSTDDKLKWGWISDFIKACKP